VILPIGKTVVSSGMNRPGGVKAAAEIGGGAGRVQMVSSDGLLGGTLGFWGEESAGASFLRRDGTVWTTDKDRNHPWIACGRKSPPAWSAIRATLYDRLDPAIGSILLRAHRPRPASLSKENFEAFDPRQLDVKELAAEPVEFALSRAPGNNEPIRRIKLIAKSGWFAARPRAPKTFTSSTPKVFRDAEHLRQIQHDAQSLHSEFSKAQCLTAEDFDEPGRGYLNRGCNSPSHRLPTYCGRPTRWISGFHRRSNAACGVPRESPSTASSCVSWIHLFALGFRQWAVVDAGLVLSYEIGTNWSVFAERTSNVIGPFFSYEVQTAFFLESRFQSGIMLSGWTASPSGLHIFSCLHGCARAVASAFWTLAANSWMADAVRLSHRGEHFQIESWRRQSFTPSFPIASHT